MDTYKAWRRWGAPALRAFALLMVAGFPAAGAADGNPGEFALALDKATGYLRQGQFHLALDTLDAARQLAVSRGEQALVTGSRD